MSSAPWLESDVSLKALNTFGLPAHARRLVRIREDADVRRVLDSPAVGRSAKLVLGGGSNLVLTRDIDEVVLKVEVGGLRLVETRGDAFIVEAGAGLTWHDVVTETLERGWPGLENLALIPGTVGAAPVQNIGAYGLEMADRFDSLDGVDLVTGLGHHAEPRAVPVRVPRQRVQERAGRQGDHHARALPAAAGRGSRCWAISSSSARSRRRASRNLRRARSTTGSAASAAPSCPTPAVIGNAGSFFKNPIVSEDQCRDIIGRDPHVVHYPMSDGTFKLAAGWLIDACGWKGKSIGRAGVYEKQALVLVNRGDAIGAEVVTLAKAIQESVYGRFGIRLEPEPVVL